MSSDLFVLVSSDGSLAQETQRILSQQLRRPAPLVPYEDIRGHLLVRGQGLVVAVVQGPKDVEPTLRLVQEIILQDLPLEVAVIERAGHSEPALASLDGLICRRVQWPTESHVLLTMVQPWVARGAGLIDPSEEPAAERISRSIMHFTPSLRDLIEPMSLAAVHDVPVLISGETGTGKTHFARLLHDCSPRRQHRFLVVSCGALSSTLMESELFGHVKGAFTGADQNKEGKFAAAGQGTLLLDEIDTLSPEQQANLLRVLETGEFESVGSNQTQQCQARIIVASNRDLETAVACGQFRRDLYYRLHVLAFHLPPLRDRRQDLAPLTRAFVARYNTKFRKNLTAISPEAIAALQSFDWPGNIRQLENVVQQAVLVSSGPTLLRSYLPQTIQRAQPTESSLLNNSLHHNRQDIERAIIRRALLRAENSRTRAARTLGISRVTLYKKMRQYGLLDPAPEPTMA